LNILGVAFVPSGKNKRVMHKSEANDTGSAVSGESLPSTVQAVSNSTGNLSTQGSTNQSAAGLLPEQNSSATIGELGGGGNDYSAGDEPPISQLLPTALPKKIRLRALPSLPTENVTVLNDSSVSNNAVTNGTANSTESPEKIDFRGVPNNNSTAVGNNTALAVSEKPASLHGQNKMAAEQFPNQTWPPRGLDRQILASALHKLSRLNLDLSSRQK
jgi:hypothetical protein